MYSIGNPRNPARVAFGGNMPSIGNPQINGNIALARALAEADPNYGAAMGQPRPGASALQVTPQQMNAPAPQPPMPSGPTPEERPGSLPYNQEYANALSQPDFSPAPTTFSALARVLGGGLGTYMGEKNRQQDETNSRIEQQNLARVLAGLPPELQAYGKVDPKGALGLQAKAAMEPPKPPQAPREQTVTVPGGDFGNMTVRQQEQNGRWVDQAIMGREPEKAAPAFGGTGLDAQALNIVAGYQQKRANNVPTTPQEDYIYALAERELTAPRVVGTPEAGFNQVTPPPLPQYPGAQPQAQAAPAGTPGNATVTPLTQAQAAPPSDRQRAQAEGINNAISAVQALIDDVETNGLQTFGIGEGGGRQSTLVNNAKLQLKNAYDLGALQGADMGLLLDILGDPTAFGTRIAGLGGPGNFLGKARTTLQTFEPQIRNLPEAAFPGGKYPTLKPGGNGSRNAGDRFPGFTATPVGP